MITIPYGRHDIDESDIEAVVDVLKNGWITQGPQVSAFEKSVAEYVGAKYAVAVANGTAALHLSYLALGVKDGDDIVTSPNTFVATANGARYCGGNVHFVDIDKDTHNIDISLLQKKCEELKAPKVLAPVHFSGLPVDMRAVQNVAHSCGARIIEDAAHALGAEYSDGSRVGNCKYSDLTIFSFHPVKMIAAGEGGMITTNDDELYRELLRLRSHGINKADDDLICTEAAFDQGCPNPWYYEMQELGFNYRITDIQCALANSQMKRLPSFLQRRRQLALRYDQLLVGTPNLRVTAENGRMNSAHHLYIVEIDFEKIGKSRREVMSELLEKGIGTQVHYIPVYRQPYYQKLGHQQKCYPKTEDYYRKALTLPLYYSLSDEQQQYVVDNLQSILA